jgi:5-(carboxyamino)imidazole ribonucleotide mutase
MIIFEGVNDMPSQKIQVGVVMGSKSDWDVMKHCAETLDKLRIGYEAAVVSAHRTPDRLFDYASSARGRGLTAIIAGAGGAAHLPGMLAAKTTLSVIGVPIPATQLNGMDALFSIVQMPGGVPVATMAIGKAGAINAALFAASILAHQDPAVAERLAAYRFEQTQKVLANLDPRQV